MISEHAVQRLAFWSGPVERSIGSKNLVRIGCCSISLFRFDATCFIAYSRNEPFFFSRCNKYFCFPILVSCKHDGCEFTYHETEAMLMLWEFFGNIFKTFSFFRSLNFGFDIHIQFMKGHKSIVVDRQTSSFEFISFGFMVPIKYSRCSPILVHRVK